MCTIIIWAFCHCAIVVLAIQSESSNIAINAQLYFNLALIIGKALKTTTMRSHIMHPCHMECMSPQPIACITENACGDKVCISVRFNNEKGLIVPALLVG